jgi:hypothetical protein
MASLRKDVSVPWSRLSDQIMRIHATFAGVKNEQLQISDRILTEFVLQAMDGDQRYSIDVSMIRRTRPVPTLEIVMAELTSRASKIESKGAGRRPLTGLVAEAEDTIVAADVGGDDGLDGFVTVHYKGGKSKEKNMTSRASSLGKLEIVNLGTNAASPMISELPVDVQNAEVLTVCLIAIFEIGGWLLKRRK